MGRTWRACRRAASGIACSPRWSPSPGVPRWSRWPGGYKGHPTLTTGRRRTSSARSCWPTGAAWSRWPATAWPTTRPASGAAAWSWSGWSSPPTWTCQRRWPSAAGFRPGGPRPMTCTPWAGSFVSMRCSARRPRRRCRPTRCPCSPSASGRRGRSSSRPRPRRTRTIAWASWTRAQATPGNGYPSSVPTFPWRPSPSVARSSPGHPTWPGSR